MALPTLDAVVLVDGGVVVGGAVVVAAGLVVSGAMVNGLSVDSKKKKLVSVIKYKNNEIKKHNRS